MLHEALYYFNFRGNPQGRPTPQYAMEHVHASSNPAPPPFMLEMASSSSSKPSIPLPPGVVPSESRDDFNDLVDSAKEKLDDKDPNNIIKEVVESEQSSVHAVSYPVYIHDRYFVSQGVLSGGTVSSSNEATEVEVAAAVSGTPANAWISPEKHAQTFHIDLSEFIYQYY